MTSGDRQSSQEQWTKETKKEPKWKDIRKASYEAGLHIKDRNATWQKSYKEGQKKRGMLVDTSGKIRVST